MNTLHLKLVTKRNPSHAILDTEDVVIDRIHTVKLVTTGWSHNGQLGVINARKVECTSGLHFAHCEAKWPRERGEILENVIW